MEKVQNLKTQLQYIIDYQKHKQPSSNHHAAVVYQS